MNSYYNEGCEPWATTNPFLTMMVEVWREDNLMNNSLNVRRTPGREDDVVSPKLSYVWPEENQNLSLLYAWFFLPLYPSLASMSRISIIYQYYPIIGCLVAFAQMGVYKVIMPQLLLLYKSRHLQGTSEQEAHELTSREFQSQNTSFTLHFFLWVCHCRMDFQKSKSIRSQVWPYMSRSCIPPQIFLPQLGRLKITWDHNMTCQFSSTYSSETTLSVLFRHFGKFRSWWFNPRTLSRYVTSESLVVKSLNPWAFDKSSKLTVERGEKTSTNDISVPLMVKRKTFLVK